MGLYHEPAVHFALAGGALFLLHAWLGPPAEEQLRVDAELVSSRREILTGEAPEGAALQSLIEAETDEALLIAEARRLGLDREDPIVRRRLLQKMEFLIDDLAAAGVPRDQDLEALIDPERDRLPGRIWFSHAFFPEAGPDQIAAGLERVKKGLPAGQPFVHGERIDGWSENRVGQVFGTAFVEALRAAPASEWIGPIRSSYGAHVVRVDRRAAPRAMTLREARSRLVQRWRVRRRTEKRSALLARLRERYDVEVIGR